MLNFTFVIHAYSQYTANELNRLHGQTLAQSQEIETLKSILQISLKGVVVLDGTESAPVIVEKIQFAAQIVSKNYVQNDHKSFQLREEFLQRKITELQERVNMAETAVANAKEDQLESIKSKNESERKLANEERVTHELWGRIHTQEDQHKAKIQQLEERHVLAKKKLRNQYSAELLERSDKIVDWLAQDAEANMEFFQRQFELIREENVRLQLKNSRKKFVKLQQENEQLRWEIKMANAFVSRAKEKINGPPQASEQTL